MLHVADAFAGVHIGPGDLSGETKMRDGTVDLLQSILATELTSFLKLSSLSLRADIREVNGFPAALLDCAKVDREQADAVSRRISDLGFAPDTTPATFISRAVISEQTGNDFNGVVRNLLADQYIIIENYGNLKEYCDHHDEVSSRLIQSFLEQEKEKEKIIRSFQDI